MKYLRTVEIGQGVTLVALFDTGSSHSFLDEEKQKVAAQRRFCRLQKTMKYLRTVEFGQGVTLVALFDTGSSHSFLDEEFVRRKKLRVDTLDPPHVYRQAGSGKMIATSLVTTAIVTGYGTIPESAVDVSRLQNVDMIIACDLLDSTDIMMRFELEAHGYSLDQVTRSVFWRCECDFIAIDPVWRACSRTFQSSMIQR